MESELHHLRSVIRALTRGVEPANRSAFARAFASRALAEYCRCACPGAPVMKPILADVNLEQGCETEAIRIGRHYSAVDPPTAAYLLSTLYTHLLPDDLRSERGMFFTPPPVANRLLDMVEEAGICWAEDTAIDPAAGGGAFVTPVALRMSSALRARGATASQIIDHIAAHLTGLEIDPFSGWMADVFLQIALWDLCKEAGRLMPRVVLAADSLRMGLGERRYGLVVGNPPYGRVTLEPALRKRYARSLYGHANLYGLFTDLAVQLCQPHGVIGYVTPASFLGGRYFKNLRALLAADAPPVAIDFIADRSGVFDKVLQETVLIVLERSGTSEAVSVSTTQPLGLGSHCQTTWSGGFPLPNDSHAPWLLPRDAEDVELLLGLPEMAYRLRDYGLAVSTGPLVWNRHKEQLAGRHGPGCYPLVWAESVLASGEFRFSAKKRNHKPYFTWKPSQDHLLTTQSVVLVQRTTSKEQDRRLVAALLPSRFIEEHGAAVVENHLNMIYPVNDVESVSLRAVSALLNSRVADRIFRCINGSVAVSAFELESLPLPQPEVMHELEAMLKRGATRGVIDHFLETSYRAPLAGAAA